MYRTLIIATCLLVLCSVGYGKSNIGIRGGVNFGGATLDPDDGVEIKRKSGILVSGVWESALKTDNTVFLRAEVMYVQRGWKGDAEFSNVNYTGTASTSEFAFGPFLEFRSKAKKIVAFAEFGLEAGTVLDKEIEVEILGHTTTDEFDEYSESSIGINLGGGLIFMNDKGELHTGLRYYLGMKNMIDSEDEIVLKTNGIQLMIAYLFTIKR